MILDGTAKATQWTFWIIAALYGVSSLIPGPVNPKAVADIVHWRLGRIVFGPPLVFSGDPPHYLVAIHSLIEDGDFDVSNNYQQARNGGLDAGTRNRWVQIDSHAERDRLGRELSGHSPFFAMLLAALVWPLRFTHWVEPVCIWITMLVALLGIFVFLRNVDQSSFWAPLLALATPLWCYSRDLWTEPWVTTIWTVLLFSQNLSLLAIVGVLGALIKYPFAVVPLTMGLLALWKKDYKRGWVLLGSQLLAFSVGIALVQYIFRDMPHFSLLHTARHGRLVFDWPFAGMVGLLLGPENGLLCFFPFLAWGLWTFRKGGDRYLPAVLYFLVYASYEDWRGGAGFSARYLVPMLPVMLLAVAEGRPSHRLFKVAVAYSLFWGFLGGFFPILVYDRTPLGVFQYILSYVRKLPVVG